MTEEEFNKLYEAMPWYMKGVLFFFSWSGRCVNFLTKKSNYGIAVAFMVDPDKYEEVLNGEKPKLEIVRD